MPDNTNFIIAAYAITWVTVVGYVLHLRRTRRQAERRYAEALRETGGLPQ